jgi:hypothetical protein
MNKFSRKLTWIELTSLGSVVVLTFRQLRPHLLKSLGSQSDRERCVTMAATVENADLVVIGAGKFECILRLADLLEILISPL